MDIYLFQENKNLYNRKIKVFIYFSLLDAQ
jgi:hypothetical protein